MPCDQPFARVEKIKQRKEYVFVPEEWCDSLICFKQVFNCESRPRCDTRFQAVSAASFKENNQERDRFIHHKPVQELVYEGREVCVSNKKSNMMCSKFCLFKTKQKTPHFDAPKAYQGALPMNLKKYDDVMKMAQKFVLPVRLGGTCL
jgi:hypothetical protein